MNGTIDRRTFLSRSAAGLAAVALAGPARAAETKGAIPPLVTIAGRPRERGKAYGAQFKGAIAAFLDREVYRAFIKQPSPKDEMLRYAAACAREVKAYSPIVHEEMEGLAEGAGLRLEEVALVSLHEELYHKGVLPKVEHCTAVAVGPPVTGKGGDTFVGQTWDWMTSVFGLSQMLQWKRPEGPSLLAYAFPGLWVGAGLNSAGLALCWTSAGFGDKGARVGIPSYALLTHLLYQETLGDVEKEAKRAKNAGWFTFVMADGKGNLLNVEGSPREVVTERHEGRLVRIGYGSRKMTGTPPGQEVKRQERCGTMERLLKEEDGKIDAGRLQHFFAEPKCGISVGKATIDMMVYDTTRRVAYLSRGPDYGTAWKTFRFDTV
jgi:hypothetical protein